MHQRLIHRGRWSLLVGMIVTLVGVFFAANSSVVLAQDGPVGAAYRGKTIFSQRCTRCHGLEGKGDGPMAGEAPVPIADFTDPTFVESRSPQEVYDTITNGRMENFMPPWRDALSDQQRWDLAAYIWSLHLAPAEITAAGELYDSTCEQCHGLDGAGTDQVPVVPNLGDALWLEKTDADLQSAISEPSHPPAADLADADLRLATASARNFGLGSLVFAASAEGDGQIDVLVQNQTTGAVMADTAVSLYIFDGDTFVEERSAMTDEGGRATFDGLSTDSNWVYIAETIYGEFPYGSDIQQFEAASSNLQIPLAVYEVGATEDDVLISRAHWVVSLESPGRVDVGELYVVNNVGNRVYTGETGADGSSHVLRFELPSGAFNIGVEGAESGDRFLIQDNLVVDTVPLPPGGRQILVRYSLPIEDGQATLAHPIAYPVDILNLLVPDLGMTVEAPGWVQGENMGTQGVAYLNYTITGVDPSMVPSATLSGISADIIPENKTPEDTPRQIIDANATPGISGQPYFPFIIGVVGALILVAGTIYLVRRQRAMQAEEPELRERQRQELVHEIAALDDAWDAGELSRSEYDTQRRLLKSQLAELMREDDVL